MQGEYENVIALTDADGIEAEYEIMDVIPYNGCDYAVLLPLDNDAEPAEAVVLELLPSDEDADEDMLRGVEEPAVLDAVFALFLQRNEELAGE